MSPHALTLAPIDYTILVLYFLFVLGIGWALKRHMKGSAEFFSSGRSIPGWVTGLAFLSANLGAQEVIGMAASGAKYGVMQSHFYWIGAIPAMVFLGLFMMPFYYGSKARSVPEYLRMRFDEKTRGFNALSFAFMTVLSSGISLFAMAKLLELLLHWNFDLSMAISALIVLVYVVLGGLTSAIYNEVLQFFMIIFGFAPLAWLGLRDVGGWGALKVKLAAVATDQGFAAGTWTESWRHVGAPADNPMGVEWFGLAMGLGFVLSFGYWCTDFLVIQRAMAANSMGAARRTPLIAAFPKMLFPFLVILPGMVAVALLRDHHGGFALPLEGGAPNWNLVIPVMLGHYLPAGLLGLGFTALMAAFMSGMAGNVTAFNTVWTYDIYQSYLAPGKSDRHYLTMGRAATIAGVLISVLAAYYIRTNTNIMDLLQLLFAFVNAPLFATFLLGMFWKRSTGHGAFWGLLIGTLLAVVHHGLTVPAHASVGQAGGWLGATIHTYPSPMAQSFWTAIVAWSGCMIVTVAISLATRRNKTDAELAGLVYSLTLRPPAEIEPWYKKPVVLGGLVLAVTVLLNLIFA